MASFTLLRWRLKPSSGWVKWYPIWTYWRQKEQKSLVPGLNQPTAVLKKQSHFLLIRTCLRIKLRIHSNQFFTKPEHRRSSLDPDYRLIFCFRHRHKLLSDDSCFYMFLHCRLIFIPHIFLETSSLCLLRNYMNPLRDCQIFLQAFCRNLLLP